MVFNYIYLTDRRDNNFMKIRLVEGYLIIIGSNRLILNKLSTVIFL